jgi:hypothetical protein
MANCDPGLFFQKLDEPRQGSIGFALLEAYGCRTRFRPGSFSPFLTSHAPGKYLQAALTGMMQVLDELFFPHANGKTAPDLFRQRLSVYMQYRFWRAEIS